MFTPEPQPHFVDRVARDKAAQLLRQFASGRITNDEFADECPETLDPGILAIWDTCWIFYDGLREHKLIGKYRLSHDQRNFVKRMVLFLDSNNQYLWPELRSPGIDPYYRKTNSRFKALYSLNMIPTAKVDKFLSSGYYPVWPFLKKKEYLQALATPKRLAGKAKEA